MTRRGCFRARAAGDHRRDAQCEWCRVGRPLNCHRTGHARSHGWSRPSGQQPAETRVFVGEPRTQAAVSILQHTVTTSKERAGNRVGTNDPPAPIHAEHSGQAVAEDFHERIVQCSGRGECGADPDELANIGREAPDHVDLIGFGAIRPARRAVQNAVGPRLACRDTSEFVRVSMGSARPRVLKAPAASEGRPQRRHRLFGTPTTGNQQIRARDPARFFNQHRCLPPPGVIHGRFLQRSDDAIEAVHAAHRVYGWAGAPLATRRPCSSRLSGGRGPEPHLRNTSTRPAEWGSDGIVRLYRAVREMCVIIC